VSLLTPAGRSPRRAAVLAALLALAAPPPAASTAFDYELELPAEQRVSYRLEFLVEHPGPVAIEASWTDAARVLSFGLERPGATSLRRSGPTPQRIDLEAPEAAAIAEGQTWVLTISGLPARRASRGSLRITVPDGVVANQPAERSPQAPVAEPEPWARRRSAPPGAPPGHLALYDATERFRAMVVEDGRVVDSCDWQESLLRALGEQLDRLEAAPPAFDPVTVDVLDRMVATVDEIRELAESSDPLFTTPAPRDDARRRAWTLMRRERLSPLRARLDELFNDVRRGYAPELEGAEWPARFLGCLTACERHFEERALVDGAGSGICDQWDRILVASAAVGSLADLFR
jgi:hypothetical protein